MQSETTIFLWLGESCSSIVALTTSLTNCQFITIRRDEKLFQAKLNATCDSLSLFLVFLISRYLFIVDSF